MLLLLCACSKFMKNAKNERMNEQTNRWWAKSSTNMAVISGKRPLLQMWVRWALEHDKEDEDDGKRKRKRKIFKTDVNSINYIFSGEYVNMRKNLF